MPLLAKLATIRTLFNSGLIGVVFTLPCSSYKQRSNVVTKHDLPGLFTLFQPLAFDTSMLI